MEQSYCAYYKLNKSQKVASVPFFRKWNEWNTKFNKIKMEHLYRSYNEQQRL